MIKEAMSIGRIQKLDLENMNKLIRPCHVDVEVQEPKVKPGWLPFLYLVGTLQLRQLENIRIIQSLLKKTRVQLRYLKNRKAILNQLKEAQI